MEVDLKIIIEVIALVLSIGGVLWKVSRSEATMQEKMKTVFNRLDKIDEKDHAQDDEIKEIRTIATDTKTSVAVIEERTKNMDQKLDQILAKD